MAETPVRLKCVCGVVIVRASFETGHPWVHHDDEMKLLPGFSKTKYDHEAQPDVIEAKVIEDVEPPQSAPVQPVDPLLRVHPRRP